MQIVFSKCGDILPRVSAELRFPVRRRSIRRAVPPYIVVHVVGITRKGAFEPRVLGRCVIEYHVKHQPDAARLCCANECVHVLHRAETRVDGTVVRDIVTIVVLR